MVKEVEDLRLMPEFVKEGVVTEQELDEQYARAMHRIEELELRNMLRRDEDRMGAIMDINSGAGGTEALDWAGMLLRMYTRWGEAHGYKVKVLDYQAGEEVGVKSCTLEFEGEYAYGYAEPRCERCRNTAYQADWRLLPMPPASLLSHLPPYW